MRNIIVEKLEEIRSYALRDLHSVDGTAIGTEEEMQWMAERLACDGILITLWKQPETWQKGDECYYFFSAISIKANKKWVRGFVDGTHYKDVCVGDMRKLLPKSTITDDDLRVAENIKAIISLLKARDSRRRRRERQEAEDQWIADYNEAKQAYERCEAERQEAADHCNDLEWMVDRIEAMGWEVTLKRHRRRR